MEDSGDNGVRQALKMPRSEVAGKKPRPMKTVVPSSSEKTKMGGKREAGKAKKGATLQHAGGIKKPHRFRPGIVAEREIRRYQKTGDSLSQAAPFERQVRDILALEKADAKLGKQALKALQVSGEAFLTDMFTRAQEINMLTEHDTLMVGELRRAAKEMGIPLVQNQSDFSRTKIARADRARVRREKRSAVKSDK